MDDTDYFYLSLGLVLAAVAIFLIYLARRIIAHRKIKHSRHDHNGHYIKVPMSPSLSQTLYPKAVPVGLSDVPNVTIVEIAKWNPKGWVQKRTLCLLGSLLCVCDEEWIIHRTISLDEVKEVITNMSDTIAIFVHSERTLFFRIEFGFRSLVNALESYTDRPYDVNHNQFLSYDSAKEFGVVLGRLNEAVRHPKHYSSHVEFQPITIVSECGELVIPDGHPTDVQFTSNNEIDNSKDVHENVHTPQQQQETHQMQRIIIENNSDDDSHKVQRHNVEITPERKPMQENQRNNSQSGFRSGKRFSVTTEASSTPANGSEEVNGSKWKTLARHVFTRRTLRRDSSLLQPETTNDDKKTQE
eukprot:PhF_6_TR11308/c0_g1_i1/m.18255